MAKPLTSSFTVTRMWGHSTREVVDHGLHDAVGLGKMYCGILEDGESRVPVAADATTATRTIGDARTRS